MTIKPILSGRTVIVDMRAFFPPQPKFQIGDIARHGYGKEKGIVRIYSRRYVPNHGWVYGHEYRSHFGGSGGSCGWPAEAEYIPLTDPLDKLRAARMVRLDQKTELERQIRKLNEEVDHLDFAITLAQGAPRDAAGKE